MARKMKDSGIEWIGEIPEGWEVTKLKYLATFPIEKNAHIDSPYIGLENIESWTGKYVSSDSQYDKSQALTFSRNNILFGKLRPYLAKVFCASNDGCCSSEFCILNFSSSVNIRYFWNLLISPTFIDHVTKSTYGTKMPRANTDFIKNICAPVPPRIEQDRIALYLDASSAKIDSLISETRSSIEEYKKLKQAVITQAVTKGVRGEREMKDSGVAWIGEIPKEWDIIKSSRIIKTTQNGLSRRDLEKSEGQIILKLKNITSDGKIDYSFLNRITLSQNELNTYALTTGDFLFVRVNGSKSLVGKCAIFEAISEIVAYNDHIIRVKLSNQCYNRFFLWYLYSCCGKAEIDLHTSTAAGQYTISGDGLRDITLVFPPIDEQKEIADYLDAKCAEIDGLIAKKEQLVKELESYKKSLIYEVVTGKREV